MRTLAALEGGGEAATLLLLCHLPAEERDEERDHEDGRRLQDELRAACHGPRSSLPGYPSRLTPSG